VVLSPTLFAVFVFSHRLMCAYRHYLQFDHPLATVASSQIITGLVLVIVLVFCGQ